MNTNMERLVRQQYLLNLDPPKREGGLELPSPEKIQISVPNMVSFGGLSPTSLLSLQISAVTTTIRLGERVN